MREWSYTLTRHELGRPWIIVGRERLTVELEDGVEFYEWAQREWPSERFTVELDPWQLGPRDYDSRMDYHVIVFAGSPPEYRKGVGRFSSPTDAAAWCERKGYTFQPNAGEWAAIIPRPDDVEIESPE